MQLRFDMPIKSDAQRRAVAKYNSNNYDQIQIRVPKGWKHKILAYSSSKNESLNGFIKKIIKQELEANGYPLENEEEE